MRPPRATLTMNAVGFISASWSSLIMPVVSGVFGMWMVMKSDCGEQLVEGQQLHAELLRAGRGDVRVVGDDLGAERLQAGGDERADAAEADDADGLLVELDARVLRALPLPLRERAVGGRDVAGEAQDVADGQLGGRDDVRGRRVDDHDAGGGRRLDVDVVEPDAGARDDLELRGGGDRLGVDLRRGAHEDRVRVRERGEQRRAVGAVDGPDLEVGPEGVDGGGREFFGDQDDRLCHVAVPSRWEQAWEASATVIGARSPHTLPAAEGALRRVTRPRTVQTGPMTVFELVQLLVRTALAAVFVFMGVLHFRPRSRRTMAAMIPPGCAGAESSARRRWWPSPVCARSQGGSACSCRRHGCRRRSFSLSSSSRSSRRTPTPRATGSGSASLATPLIPRLAAQVVLIALCVFCAL